MDHILSVSESIRYVLVVDSQGEMVLCHTTPRSFIGKDQSESIARDVHFLKGLLRVYDDVVGENIFTHLIRARGHILMFYESGWIFLVSCDNASRQEIADMADEIEDVIHSHMH